ncbi:MAG: Flp pilus assembly protein CpaB [Blastopirellula sp.]|nr:MAG: Flp pilus assembly protein CpaB [Blastopirellula sp.]
MTMRTTLVLILALVCGISAAVGSSFFLGPKEVVKEAEVTEILVAAVEIKRGTQLQPEFVKKQAWPTALVPEGALLTYEQLESRIAFTSFVVGEPLLESRIAEGTFGAASLVTPGMRAFTIATPSATSGVAGFVMPGNRVDVLLTMKQDDNEAIGGSGTWTLLQNVEILAADTRLESDGKSNAGKLTSVTLHVTPDKAIKLTLAATLGTLTLTLRNDGDNEIAEIDPVTAKDLRNLQEAMLGIVATPVVETPEPIEEPKPLPEPVEKPIMLAKKQPAQILIKRGHESSIITINHR